MAVPAYIINTAGYDNNIIVMFVSLYMTFLTTFMLYRCKDAVSVLFSNESVTNISYISVKPCGDSWCV